MTRAVGELNDLWAQDKVPAHAGQVNASGTEKMIMRTIVTYERHSANEVKSVPN